MRITLGVVLVVVGLAACGGDDGSSASDGPVEIDEAAMAASNYDTSYIVCEGTADGTINDDSGITVDPNDQPEAYASAYAAKCYRPEYRPVASDGCLDGLLGRPKDPPTT